MTMDGHHHESGEGISPWWTSQKRVRRQFQIPEDLSEFSLEDLEHLHAYLLGTLNSPGANILPPQVRRFLKDELIRIDKQASILMQQNQIQVIQEEVAKGDISPELREELTAKLDELARVTDQIAEKMTSANAAAAESQSAEETWKRRKELLEHLLAREPAAVLVGALLLVGIASALIGAMFSHTEIPEIMSSAFLLILGFFFGQNAARGGGSGDSN